MLNRHPLSRRTFLRGTGVAMALPMCEAMSPAAESKVDEPRRMVAINIALGLYAKSLFPAQVGRDYAMTPYLKTMEDLRDEFTIFSGMSHPGVDGGHAAEKSFLTAAPNPGSNSFRNSISLDQLAAERVGSRTRFGYLALGTGTSGFMSWSRSGVRIPCEDNAAKVFERLFLAGDAKEIARQVERLRDGQSILDTVGHDARRMHDRISKLDRRKLDEYFTAVRDAERRLVKAEQWSKKPKPKVEANPPEPIDDVTDIVRRMQTMYDVMHLALQTDSTRIITFNVGGLGRVPKIQGITTDYHNLSHHGKDPGKIEQLQVVELEVMNALSSFLRKLHSTEEQNGTLLHRTMVFTGSNLGNASSHTTKNMPVIFAGGGFKHGQHLAFDAQRNYPLPNLFLTMLHRLGIHEESFASSTGTMRGLELARG
ncbi:MAG: DUF1552 domain-containing protein [Pirellulales bacterium]|nr:DUF1552 domain-containing protein [Pirellulales bacterium]